MNDPRQFAPSTARNRDPLLTVLARPSLLGDRNVRVLELASGSGEHGVHFAARLPGLVWQPSDPSAEARRSIDAWRAQADLEARVLPALALDVEQRPWPVGRFDALVCVNMLHIAPWSACEALFAEARDHLVEGGALVTYGPYKRGGAHTAPSNEAFDQSLRARDPRWGVRCLDDVARLAAAGGLALEEVVEMPANNLTVVFRLVGA